MPDAQFTVPYPVHSHFVGREDDLQRLHAALQGEGPVGINPAALGNPTGVTGQGGIGKTQLAVAYAYRYRAAYPDGVYWLNAAESLWSEFANLGRHFLGQGGEGALKARLYETIRARFKVEEVRELCFELSVKYEEFSPQLGISSLARELVEYCERRGQLGLLEAAVRRLRGDLAQPEARDELVAYAFIQLRERPHCLLILDNVAAPEVLDEPLTGDCVPGRLPGRLLFSTRRRGLGRFQPVELKTLPPDAALRLLLRDPRRQPALDLTHPEHATARDICATFGYLPLALEIAAAHLAKHPTAPLAAYRDELRRRGARDVMADRHVTVETRHKTGLDAALEAQWATLGEEAQTLLRVAGQLPEAAYMPVARLGLLAGVPEEGQSFFDVTLAGALDELNSASLIEELAGDEARLHPLVRDFARDRTPLEGRDTFRMECVRRLLDALGDIKTLEQQCNARGIDALIRDLLAAQDLLHDLSPFVVAFHPAVSTDLWDYLAVLRREAHNLRGWRRDDSPTFLAQQLHLRLFDSATPALFGDLAAHLRSRGQVWQPRWAAWAVSPALEMSMTGNGDRGLANAVALTPDGRRAVSAGEDATLHVWNLDTGQEEQSLAGHWGPVYAVALTPDGRRAVSVGEDGTLRVWNLDTGQGKRMLADHRGPVYAVALTPDGRRAVSGGSDETLRVWNLDTGQEEQTLAGHTGMVNALALAPDGRRAVSAGADATLRVWNLDTGQEERTLVGHEGEVLAVALTTDGRQAVSGGSDKTLRVWNLDMGQGERILAGHRGPVYAVALTPDGRRAVSGGSDETLRVWNLDMEQGGWMLAGHRGPVYAVALTPDGRRAVSGGSDETLRVWNLDMEQGGWSPAGHTGGVAAVATAAATTPDGRRTVSGGGDGTLRVWNLDTGQEKRTLAGHEGPVYAVVLTEDGRRAVSGGYDTTLRVWNLDTGQEERTLAGHEGPVYAVALTEDRRRAVSGGYDATLRVWNLDTGQEERTLTGHVGPVYAVAVTPDGWRAVSGGMDGALYVWNLHTGQGERTLTGPIVLTYAVAVTPDGQRAVSGGIQGMLHVWNLDTGQVERTLEGSERRIIAVTLTPDGRCAVSGGGDGTLRLWELATGRELGRAALDSVVECVAVVPDSPWLVIVGDAAGNVTCLEWVE